MVAVAPELKLEHAVRSSGGGERRRKKCPLRNCPQGRKENAVPKNQKKKKKKVAHHASDVGVADGSEIELRVLPDAVHMGMGSDCKDQSESPPKKRVPKRGVDITAEECVRNGPRKQGSKLPYAASGPCPVQTWSSGRHRRHEPGAGWGRRFQDENQRQGASPPQKSAPPTSKPFFWCNAWGGTTRGKHCMTHPCFSASAAPGGISPTSTRARVLMRC